jgi:hypothetical protein
MRRIALLLNLLIFLLSACGGPQVYKDVFNTEGGPNVRTFNASVDTCYLAVSRAILSQIFRIEKEDNQSKLLQATRHFQEGKKTIILTVTATVRPTGENKATVYANAVQTVEKLHTKKEYWNLLIIPTPFVKSSEAKTAKEEEKTSRGRRIL